MRISDTTWCMSRKIKKSVWGGRILSYCLVLKSFHFDYTPEISLINHIRIEDLKENTAQSLGSLGSFHVNEPSGAKFLNCRS